MTDRYGTASPRKRLVAKQVRELPSPKLLQELGLNSRPIDERLALVGVSSEREGSKNRSAVHWDMICDMRTDSTIEVDGELFYKDGAFVV